MSEKKTSQLAQKVKADLNYNYYCITLNDAENENFKVTIEDLKDFIFDDSITINASAEDKNFIVKSDTLALAFSVIGSNGNVGVGLPNTTSRFKVSELSLYNQTAFEVDNQGTGDHVVVNTDHFVIDNDGNTAIGNGTPNRRFNVEDSNDVYTRIRNSSTGIAGLELVRGSETFGSDGFTDWRMYNSGGNLLFFSQYNAGSGVRLTINGTNGNVDIGNSSNSEKLSVNGYVNADSGFKVGGTAGASGSFTTTDGKTVIVTNGIITSIV
jgi:hypothetical protein